MSSQWTKAWQNAPSIDCGLCGRGFCSGFIRAYLLGLVDIEACPLLSLPQYSSQRDELISLTTEGSRTTGRPAPEPPADGVLFTKPCADTDEKVMAELRISNGVMPGEMIDFMVFSPEMLCRQLNLVASMFERVKCSKDLGYARADYEDMSITFLNDGRVNMRRVDDEKKVKNLFNIFQTVLVGAVVCNCCGSDMFSVLSGLVNPLRETEHTVLMADVNVDLIYTLDLIRTKGYSAWDGKIPEIHKEFLSIFENLNIALNNPQEPYDIDAMKSSISEIEEATIKLLENEDKKETISNLIHILMLMYYSRIGVQSLSKIDAGTQSDVISKISGESDFNITILNESEIETAAHVYSLQRTLNLIKRWINQ